MTTRTNRRGFIGWVLGAVAMTKAAPFVASADVTWTDPPSPLNIVEQRTHTQVDGVRYVRSNFAYMGCGCPRCRDSIYPRETCTMGRPV
jgi:hypothetical protein